MYYLSNGYTRPLGTACTHTLSFFHSSIGHSVYTHTHTRFFCFFHLSVFSPKAFASSTRELVELVVVIVKSSTTVFVCLFILNVCVFVCLFTLNGCVLLRVSWLVSSLVNTVLIS